jgi:predicted amidohydrolase YtcJ
LFLDGEVGSLEPGKRADLTVFDGNPMTVPAERIPELDVVYTFVDGELAFRRDGG